jgi:enamine deaminase RidA (YjgF/YER057c/UK114 family)
MKIGESAEENLAALGFALPLAPASAGHSVPLRRAGDTVYLAGAISTGPYGGIAGTAGADRTVDEGDFAAQACALTQLAVVRRELGSLDSVEAILSLTGFVCVAPGFQQTEAVVNGASDLLVRIFGEAGRAARTVVGVSALPEGALVAVEMVVRTAVSGS